jgi:DNA-binding GntR family transcriptional regulator
MRRYIKRRWLWPREIGVPTVTTAALGAPGPTAGGDRRTRAEALRDALAEAILKGDLPAGQRLDEITLAQRYAVSRTPVREALKQLSAMALVEFRAHRGAVVAGLDPARLAELFEAMGEVEAACARLAAMRLTRASQASLEAAWAACDATLRRARDVDLERVHATNQRFHAAIHEGARNAFLAEAAQVLRRRLAPLSRAQFGLTGRPDNSAAEHEAIMAALRARDAAAAEDAMRRHLASVAAAFARWLEEGGQGYPG